MTRKQTARTVGSSARGGGGNERTHPYRSTASADAQPVRAANGRVVGHVAGGVFSKRVRGSVHMLRAPRGWALDVPTLADLRALGVVTVTVTDTESDTTYSAPLAEFSAHGVALNRGFGPQVALPLGYWRVNGQPPALAPREPDPDAPRQLSLFAEASQ
jgi:hypothetical protein